MAINIDCNICSKRIKTVGPDDISSITGKEICTECGMKIEAAFSLVAKTVKTFQQDAETMLREVKKKFQMLDKTYNQYNIQANDLWTRTRAELESLKQNIIENEMQDLPK